MGNTRHITDGQHFDACVLQGANSGLTSTTSTFYTHVHLAQTEIECFAGCGLGCQLGGKGSAFAATFET